jgi:hypothetical protein
MLCISNLCNISLHNCVIQQKREIIKLINNDKLEFKNPTLLFYANKRAPFTLFILFVWAQ